MEASTVYNLLYDNMDNLYAFSLSRLGDKIQAEDLTGEIILQVVKSYKSIRNDNAFFGFMWAVAKNTYKKYLRQRKDTVPYDCSFMGIHYETPENILLENEEIALLRRELSLLSKKYRDITVKYYISGMSCREIASELNISAENVKYTLFKVRKILKEGIEMERKYGEQSYNPKKFSPDSWGNRCYMSPLFDRRLPGNILFAAYEKPVTIQEISLELGVSPVYLEDELEILVKAGIIKEINGKYLTNIVILSEEFERAAQKKAEDILTLFVDNAHKLAQNMVDAVAELDFNYCDKSENRILWLIYFEALKLALWDCNNRSFDKIGGCPKWPDGSECLFYGHENCDLRKLDGIYGYWENERGTAYTTVFNYRVFEKCQNLQHKWDNLTTFEIMCNVIAGIPVDTGSLEVIRLIDENIIVSRGGNLYPDFPTFSSKALAELDKILKPLADELITAIDKASDEVMDLVIRYVPAHLKEQAADIAKFNSSVEAVAIFMGILVEKGILILPDTKTNLGIIGVIK